SLPPRRPPGPAELSAAAGHQIIDASPSPRPEHWHAAPLPGFALPQDEANAGLLRTLRASLHAIAQVERGTLVQQCYEIGVGSLPFLCLVLAFVGGIIVYQGGIQSLRIIPDTSGIGASYLELLVRDLAATLTGLMLATRVGASIA